MHYAGIDAGGTRTRIVFDGDTRGRQELGPLNLTGMYPADFSDRLRELMTFLSALTPCRVCLGTAGLSDVRMQRMLKDAFEAAQIPLLLKTDAEIALAGACPDGPALLLIAGTGSLCLGRDGNGKQAKAGGWGHLLGDEGSGFYLGLSLLRRLCRMLDTGEKPDLLSEAAFQRIGGCDREALISFAYTGDKARVASLAPIVLDFAATGDPAALSLVQDATGALAVLCRTVQGRLSLSEAPLYLSGAVAAHPLVARCLQVSLSDLPGLHPEVPLEDAAQGALRLCHARFP